MASNLYLPRLHPVSGNPDVSFVWRAELSDGPFPTKTFKQTLSAPDGRTTTVVLARTEHGMHYKIPGLGVYVLHEPLHLIEFFPTSGASPEKVEHHLVHEVSGLYAALRGVICLHASAVAKGEEALVFGGPSGVGKSTAAWRLLQEGWELLSDDAVVLTRSSEGWVASPGSRTIRIRDGSLTDQWESAGKVEGFVPSCATAKRVRKILLLDRGVNESTPGMASVYRSILDLQVGWVWGSPATRKKLERQTWQLMTDVECSYEARDRLSAAALGGV